MTQSPIATATIAATLQHKTQLIYTCVCFRAKALLSRVFATAEAAWDAADDGVLEAGLQQLLSRTLRGWAVVTNQSQAERLQVAAEQLAGARRWVIKPFAMYR